MAKKIIRKKKTTPTKSKDVPVIQEMLFEFRDELKFGLSSNLSAINSNKLEIQSLEKKMDSKFSSMDSKFDKVLSEIHRIGLLVEEQNARNKFVLDGLTSVLDRQDRQENEIVGIKKTLASF